MKGICPFCNKHGALMPVGSDGKQICSDCAFTKEHVIETFLRMFALVDELVEKEVRRNAMNN